MSPETLARLAGMRADRRVATLVFAGKCFAGPVAVLTAVWWVTR